MSTISPDDHAALAVDVHGDQLAWGGYFESTGVRLESTTVSQLGAGGAGGGPSDPRDAYVFLRPGVPTLGGEGGACPGAGGGGGAPASSCANAQLGGASVQSDESDEVLAVAVDGCLVIGGGH